MLMLFAMTLAWIVGGAVVGVAVTVFMSVMGTNVNPIVVNWFVTTLQEVMVPALLVIPELGSYGTPRWNNLPLKSILEKLPKVADILDVDMLDADTLDVDTMDCANTLDVDTMDCADTLDADTLDAETLDAETLDDWSIEV